MKFLHTADWHLGDRLGRIDRTEDLRRSVERVAGLCEEHDVDVMILAGDIFSELARPDNLRGSIEHIQNTFEPFLLRGGTIVAVTGNHDNETFCDTLHLVMTLASPETSKIGDVRPLGRLHLSTDPDLFRLVGKDGAEVQFLQMPWPFPKGYLRDEETQKFGTLEEKNQILREAFLKKLNGLMEDEAFNPELPTILSAHIHVQGTFLPNLFRISEQESIIFHETDLPLHLDYIALGHIHQPQMVMEMPHVRYSSSIERLDLGERKDQKGVVLFDIRPKGREGEPTFLPLPATPIYSIEITNPSEDLPRLREEYPDAEKDLVNLEIRYTAGKDNLEQILNELDQIFPRWYFREWQETSALGPSLTVGEHAHSKSFEETVRDYLEQELMNHTDDERQAVLAMAEELMREES